MGVESDKKLAEAGRKITKTSPKINHFCGKVGRMPFYDGRHTIEHQLSNNVNKNASLTEHLLVEEAFCLLFLNKKCYVTLLQF